VKYLKTNPLPPSVGPTLVVARRDSLTEVADAKWAVRVDEGEGRKELDDWSDNMHSPASER
jgi:hypothetical protein